MIKIIKRKKRKSRIIVKDAPEDKAFWLKDGRVLKNIKELASALKDMSDETFFHHVNKDKNDFMNWIKDVIEDDKLSKKISRLKKKETILKKIKESLI